MIHYFLSQNNKQSNKKKINLKQIFYTKEKGEKYVFLEVVGIKKNFSTAKTYWNAEGFLACWIWSDLFVRNENISIT